MNATMRRLDLLCNIVAPLLVSAFSAGVSVSAALFVMSAWSFVSLLVEYNLVARVYNHVPALHVKAATSAPVPEEPASASASSATEVVDTDSDRTSTSPADPVAAMAVTDVVLETRMVVSQYTVTQLRMDETGRLFYPPQVGRTPDTVASVPPTRVARVPPIPTAPVRSRAPSAPTPTPAARRGSVVAPSFASDPCGTVAHAVRVYGQSWRHYSQHPSFWASFAYCLLYINLLNLGGSMSVFLKVAFHMPDTVLAGARGVAALVGVLVCICATCVCVSREGCMAD
jgi:hypothetical protein